MRGLVLLQGGGELRAACREMDGLVLAAAPPGPVVVVLGAATPGGDHDRAAARAWTYYGAWDRAVRISPHPEEDPEGSVASLDGAAVVVLPGGSPDRLLRSLVAAGGVVGQAIVARNAAGAALSGASAGAMVLCERLVLPDRGATVAPGLDLLPGLVLPHYRPDRRQWSDPEQPDAPRWGLPECGGVLVTADGVTAVGQGTPQLLRGGVVTDVPRDVTPLDQLLP